MGFIQRRIFLLHEASTDFTAFSQVRCTKTAPAPLATTATTPLSTTNFVALCLLPTRHYVAAGKIHYFDHTDNEYNCGSQHPLTNGTNGTPNAAFQCPPSEEQTQPNADLDFHGLDLYSGATIDSSGNAAGMYSTTLWTSKAIAFFEETRVLEKPEVKN